MTISRLLPKELGEVRLWLDGVQGLLGLSREEVWMKYCGGVLGGWYIHGQRRTWPSRYIVHVTGMKRHTGIGFSTIAGNNIQLFNSDHSEFSQIIDDL